MAYLDEAGLEALWDDTLALVYGSSPNAKDISGEFTFVPRTRINYVNGKRQTNSSVSSSGYVNVEGYGYIVLTIPRVTATSNAGLAFYTSEDEDAFIADSGVRVPYSVLLEANTYTIFRVKIPDGAAYVRTSWWNSTETQYSEIAFGCIAEKVPAYVDQYTYTIGAEAADARLDAGLDVVDAKIDAGLDTVDANLGVVDKKIDTIYGDLYDEVEYESAGWISSDMDDSGAPVESTTRITTQGWRDFDGACHTCTVDAGYKFKVLLYRASETPKVVLIDWRTDRYDFASDVRKWIVVAAKTDDSAILPADGDEHVHIGTYTPKEVTVDQEDILDSVLPLVSTEPDYTTTPNVIIVYNSGVERSDNNYSATGYVDVRGCKYIVYSRLTFNIGSTPRGGIAFYRYRDVGGYISGEPANGYAESTGYETRICEVPRGASYVRLSVNPLIDGFFVRGIPGKSVLDGLKFSVLGDSISTYSGYIPAGNAAYYNGSKAGVSSVDQMWWKMLSDTLGMEYLVIDAWGGSAIAYNASTKSTHLDTVRTPMCSDLRTGRLGTETDDPDIIIVAGGTNDWLFGNQDTTPIGDWDGHTDIDRTDVTSGQSTFIESYVSMLEKLQQNYPDAIIVCSSVFFVVAKNAGTLRRNDAGMTMPDYNEAIRFACKLKGVPFIDVFNVGFTYQNYYGKYCTDSATESLHPNALGQSIIAKRYIDELPRLVQQFVR